MAATDNAASVNTKLLASGPVTNKKAPLLRSGAELLIDVGWLMGLEPTTTGITILDSTN